MPITSLRFSNLGPFDDVSFEFDKQVNVFVGPNNSGKSTALWVLAEILVYLFSIPEKLYLGADANFEIKAKVGTETRTFNGVFPIFYGHGIWNEKKTNESMELIADLGYTNYLPVLRRSTNFRSPGPSSNQESKSPLKRQDFRHYPRLASEHTNRETLFSTDDTLVSDEVVVQKMIDLGYRSYRLSQPSVRTIIDTIADVASKITDGFPIKFTRIGEDDEGLFPEFETRYGNVPLNVLSQGTQSIIQWVAHFLMGYAQYYDYPPALEEKPAVLIIDEIDAHLHPSWQRRIIPALTNHFPNLQIFCSTHSPLMLAGLKQGQVHLLKRDEAGKVAVTRNETDIIGWSADEILRNYLDVESPTDLGTVEHLKRLQELRRKDVLNAEEAEELERLRNQVNQDLLAGPIAAQTERFTDALKQAQEQSSSASKPKASRKRRSTDR